MMSALRQRNVALLVVFTILSFVFYGLSFVKLKDGQFSSSRNRSSQHHQIQVVETMDQAQTILEKWAHDHSLAPQQVLVAFDIHMTLMDMGSDPATFYPNITQHWSVFQRMVQMLTPSQKDQVWAEALSHGIVRPLPDTGKKVIAELRAHYYSMIALTATFASPDQLASLPSLMETHGFIFDPLIPDGPLGGKSRGRISPFFKKGILFSNGESTGKGAALCQFLKRLSQQSIPKKFLGVVMIDDRKENLMNIQKHLSRHFSSLQFLGLHYKGAYTLGKDHPISEETFRKFWNPFVEKVKKTS